MREMHPLRQLSRAVPAALGTLIVLMAASSPAAAQSRDSSRGAGSTASVSSFDFDYTSGPAGENPTGHSDAVFDGERIRLSGQPACFAVDGKRATFAGAVTSNPAGYTWGKV